MFEEICENVSEVRKQLKDILSNFVKNYIIPHLVPTPEVIQTWLTSEKDFVWEDNTMQDVSEKCLQGVSFTLGKQIINPLLHELVQTAQAQGNEEMALAAVVAIACAS